MKKVFLVLAMLALCSTDYAINDGTNMYSPAENEIIVPSNSNNVVFRRTQRLRCSSIKEDIVLYSSGKYSLYSDDVLAYSGTYSIEENRYVIFYDEDGNELVRASFSYKPNKIDVESLSFRGYIYRYIY